MIFRRNLVAAGLAVFLLSPTAPCGAADIVVDDRGQLESAVGNANDGDTILLDQSGTVSTVITVTGTGIDAEPASGGGFILDGGVVKDQTGIIQGDGASLINMNGHSIRSLRNIIMRTGTSTSAANHSGGAVTAGGITGDTQRTHFIGNTSESTLGGGAVHITDDFSGNLMRDTHFTDNGAKAGSGGGLYVGGSFTGSIDGSGADVHFDGNTARVNGGGMFVGGSFGAGSSRIYGNYFAGNKAETGSGGGMYVTDNFTGDLGEYAFFDANTANIHGGGLYVDKVFTGAMKLVFFTNNTAATGNGGGLYAKSMVLTSGGPPNSFKDNKATDGSGGAIHLEGATGTDAFTGTLDLSTFERNIAGGGSGGAINIADGSWKGGIAGSFFTDNRAENGNGGALNLAGGMTDGRIAETAFTRNSASGSGGNGGAVSLSRGSTVTFHNTQFTDNTASGNGGGMYFRETSGNDYNVTFSADSERSTAFTGNTDGSGANSFSVDSNANFNLSTAGSGTVDLRDPFKADVGGGFKLEHTAPGGTLIMNGTNTVDAGGKVDLLFDNGVTRVMNSDSTRFTLKVGGGTGTDLRWGANNILTIEHMEDRPTDLAIIDLTDAGGSKNFTVENGATLDITRILKPLPNQRYLLVSGLNGSPSHPDGERISEIKYLHPDGYTMIPVYEKGGTEVWLDVGRIPDAFDPRAVPPNLFNGQDCVSNWLNHTANGRALSPHEVLALRRDFHSGPPEAAAAMALVGVGIHTSAVNAARTGLLQRGRACADTGTLRFWGNYSGGIGNIRGRDQYSGYRLHSNGALVGAVRKFSSAFEYGGYFGYSRTNTDFTGLSASADSGAFHAGAQALLMLPRGTGVTADLGFSHQTVDTKRYPGGIGSSTGHFSQNLFSASVAASRSFELAERTRLAPSASFIFTKLLQNDFTEQGRVMAARVSEVNGSSLSSSLGATLEHDFLIEENKRITPGIGINWKRQYTGRKREARYAFVDNPGSGYSCTVRSREAGRDSLELSAYIDMDLCAKESNWSFRAGYTLDIGNRSVAHTFHAGAAIRF